VKDKYNKRKMSTQAISDESGPYKMNDEQKQMESKFNLNFQTSMQGLLFYLGIFNEEHKRCNLGENMEWYEGMFNFGLFFNASMQDEVMEKGDRKFTKTDRIMSWKDHFNRKILRKYREEFLNKPIWIEYEEQEIEGEKVKIKKIKGQNIKFIYEKVNVVQNTMDTDMKIEKVCGGDIIYSFAPDDGAEVKPADRPLYISKILSSCIAFDRKAYTLQENGLVKDSGSLKEIVFKAIACLYYICCYATFNDDDSPIYRMNAMFIHKFMKDECAKPISVFDLPGLSSFKGFVPEEMMNNLGGGLSKFVQDFGKQAGVKGIEKITGVLEKLDLNNLQKSGESIEELVSKGAGKEFLAQNSQVLQKVAKQVFNREDGSGSEEEEEEASVSPTTRKLKERESDSEGEEKVKTNKKKEVAKKSARRTRIMTKEVIELEEDKNPDLYEEED